MRLFDSCSNLAFLKCTFFQCFKNKKIAITKKKNILLFKKCLRMIIVIKKKIENEPKDSKF